MGHYFLDTEYSARNEKLRKGHQLKAINFSSRYITFFFLLIMEGKSSRFKNNHRRLKNPGSESDQILKTGKGSDLTSKLNPDPTKSPGFVTVGAK